MIAFDPLLRDDNHFAWFDIAYESRADDVQRTGFRGEDRGAIQFAQHKRANAPGVAHADQLFRRERHQRIGAFHLLQCIDQPVDNRLVTAARDQMNDRFGIRGRLEDRAFVHQLLPQRDSVGEIAVVPNRDPAAGKIGKHRLRVARRGAAGGGITDMAHGVHALQLLRMHAVLAEDIADETRMALGDELRAIIGDDASRFLPTMLERVQPQRRERARIVMPENAKDAALFVQGIVIERQCALLGPGHGCFPPPPSPVASMRLSSAWRASAP